MLRPLGARKIREREKEKTKRKRKRKTGLWVGLIKESQVKEEATDKGRDRCD